MEQIRSREELRTFLHEVCAFHDTCITEMRYCSGAYVVEHGMYPVNDQNDLEIILKGTSLIRLRFHGIRYCRLYPVQPEYTCEILGAAMWMDDADRIYWCNDDGVTPETVDRYKGIAVCAASLEYEIQELRFEGRGNSNAT